MKRLLLRFVPVAVALIALTATSLSFGCGEKPSRSSSPRVKNIILMVGDGMGLAQLSALSLAQNDNPMNMERASASGFVKTHSANNRVTDSAAAATAYSTGQKTNNGNLGVDPTGAHLETILEKAEAQGLVTGLVATTLIQHATPAAFYAHTTDRNDYEAIALALLSADIDVAIGGGMKYLRNRADGRNLAAELEQKNYVVTDSLEALEDITKGQVIALYDEEAIPSYVRSGRDPMMLARNTSKALEILTANTPRGAGGFFLRVEGSWIDSAGHGNDSEMLIDEMTDFDNAVGTAFDYADSHPGTLVIVLADHETGGLTLPSGKTNFLLPDSGVELNWNTTGHTATMVPMLAYGAHAELLNGIIDNTAINHLMTQLLDLK
jgi:alkaline phosphatase